MAEGRIGFTWRWKMNLRVGDLLGCFDGDEVGLAVVGDEVGFYRDYKQAVRVYPFCDSICANLCCKEAY